MMRARGGRRGGRGATDGRGRGKGRGMGDAPEPIADADTEQAFSLSDESSPMVIRLQSALLNVKSSFAEHLRWASEAPESYVAELLLLLHSVDVPRSSKINALLVGFERRDAAMLELLFADTKNFALPEVSAAARALDCARRTSCLERKIADVTRRITATTTADSAAAGAALVTTAPAAAAAAPVRPRGGGRGGRGRYRDIDAKADRSPRDRRARRQLASLARFKAELGTRSAERVTGLTATLSGHNAKYFCEWAERIEEDDLAHFLLEFGLEPWRELADLVHINPKRLKLPCFLPYAFADARRRTVTTRGGEKRVRESSSSNTDPTSGISLPPALSFALELKKSALLVPIRTRLDEIVKHRLSFGFLRKVYPTGTWDDRTKLSVARYLSMTTLLWWFEDLSCVPVEALIAERLAAGETPEFGYGKLMERLMLCSAKRSHVLGPLIPVAQQSISAYSMPLRMPMAVLGDCSGSMEVAVRVSSIIVSLMAALGSAHLFFFNDKCIHPPFVPSTIKEVLIVGEDVVASGPTAPAAALEQLFFNGVCVETLVIVTDEHENQRGPLSNLFFHELLIKYRETIAPTCSVVLVSFLGPTETGEMAAQLSSLGIPYLQCRLNSVRPDLTKLDNLLGKLALVAPLHSVAVTALAMVVRAPAGAARLQEMVGSSLDFKRNAAQVTVQLISAAAAVVPDEQAADLLALVSDFVACLADGDFATSCRERLSSCGPPGGIDALRRWISNDWGIAFSQRATDASKPALKEQLLVRAPFRCGTLSLLPQEVMGVMLSYLPRDGIDNAARAAPTLARVCHEARFDSKFYKKKGPYDDQLDRIRMMGLLEAHDEATVMELLRRTNGNIDHCVALLFGERRR